MVFSPLGKWMSGGQSDLWAVGGEPAGLTYSLYFWSFGNIKRIGFGAVEPLFFTVNAAAIFLTVHAQLFGNIDPFLPAGPEIFI